MLDSSLHEKDRNIQAPKTNRSDATNLNRKYITMGSNKNGDDSISLTRIKIHNNKMDDVDDNNDSINIDSGNSPSDEYKYDDDDNKELIKHKNKKQDRDLSKEFFYFKTHVKNKRKATFCCIFSIGSLILSIILLLAPLSTQMNTQYKKYHQSTEYQCIISNKTYLNGTQYKHQQTPSPTNPIRRILDDDNNITNNITNKYHDYGDYGQDGQSQQEHEQKEQQQLNVQQENEDDTNNDNNDDNMECIFIYSRIDGNKFTDKCSTMYEQNNQPCNISRNGITYDINHTDQCYFYNDDNNLCQGTMIDALMLERNNNMFIILLSIGSLFAVITIGSGIYGIRLIRSEGIYCSVMSIQQDDDKIFGLMRKFQEEEKYKKERLGIKDSRNSRNKTNIESIMSGSSQLIGSSTINSSTINSSTFTELSSDFTSTH